MINKLIMVAAILSLGACLHNDHLDYEMGLAVHEMVESQIYNKAAAANPPKGVVNGLDGSSGESIINAHRSGANTLSGSDENIHFKMNSD